MRRRTSGTLEHRTSKAERRSHSRAPHSMFGVHCSLFIVPHFTILLLLVSTSHAPAASLGPQEEKLVLSPPHAEIPPTFWEQYGVWTIVSGFLLLALLVLIVAWKLRPKPPVVVPIEVQTRKELELLRQQPRNGLTLSEISRALRHYFICAFDLPAGEMTTTEFREVLSQTGKAGPDLANQTIDFLRRCDESKFAPDASPENTAAADQALALLEAGELRRKTLREAAASKPPFIS